ncbi:toxin-antitoxin system YwqK family antitoxin [Algimonas porphyrae]|uniref:Toxin-antitoxin system YwqK family antitoxin n=1 Tax=Algimonas porphyrae TaxID=1128113 RepID=A0ABQ5V3A0_9PROT|nr:hypothetical protein [Algimonas porphyrae]GLQ21066.1 hypothetical protein GCM10007854_20210 [Algimonas porphyrae]
MSHAAIRHILLSLGFGVTAFSPSIGLAVDESQHAVQPFETAFQPGKGGTVLKGARTDADGLVRTPDGKLATGLFEDRFETGSIRVRRFVKDGKAHGVWLEYDPDGQLRFYSEWRNGLGHGLWIYFHDNGWIRERSTVLNDRWHGVSEGWDPDGRKRFEAIYIDGEKRQERSFSAKEEIIK